MKSYAPFCRVADVLYCAPMLEQSRSLLHAASLLLLEACNGGAHRGGRARGQGPAATSHGALAGLGVALPDATGDALHILLATKGAHVPGALLDLVTLHDLSKRGTIAGAVLACDANLLRALGHGCCRARKSHPHRVPWATAAKKAAMNYRLQVTHQAWGPFT